MNRVGNCRPLSEVLCVNGAHILLCRWFLFFELRRREDAMCKCEFQRKVTVEMSSTTMKLSSHEKNEHAQHAIPCQKRQRFRALLSVPSVPYLSLIHI